MCKPPFILFIFFYVALISMTVIEKPTSVFQAGVDSFIKKHSVDFSEVSETYSAGSNDFVLDKSVKTSWKRSSTLKGGASFKNKYDQTVYQRLYLGFYEYETKDQCASALDSLLNCLGTDCQKIKWGDKTPIKSTPTFYLINETQIIVCKISCEHENDFWIKFKKDLGKTFGAKGSRSLEMGCGGVVGFGEI